MSGLPRLQFLTLDASPLGHRDQALAALQGGVRWIQFRTKTLPEAAAIAEAARIAELCRDYGATFIINDSPRIALAAEADGVHLGPNDPTPAEARQLLGAYAVVGVTLNFPAHLERLRGAAVDYAGVGPVRATASKAQLAPLHTPESLAALIAGAAPCPCYAIGGVTAEDFPALRRQGAHGIAVSGAIALAGDPTAAARALVAAVSA
jgi:thiamine-phosphate pyrophosphorylase